MKHAEADPAWWFHTSLDPGLSMAERRAWYRRMHRRVSSLGLAVATRLSVSVVVGVGRPMSTFDRNKVIAWLVDEAEVWAIQIGELIPVNVALETGIPILPVADRACHRPAAIAVG